MATNQFGRTGGFFSVGEVVDRFDPTQSGLLKVNWNMGGANQNEIGKTDLPWSKALYPSSNPSLKQTGGPHTGLREGSRVFGFSMDGQDYVILGSIVQGGKGEPDGKPEYDSEIPRPAKSEKVEGDGQGQVDPQPRYGDKNDIVTQKSIWKYAEEEGGQDKKAAKYPSYETVGMLDDALTA
jgi:hypothetical protein